MALPRLSGLFSSNAQAKAPVGLRPCVLVLAHIAGYVEFIRQNAASMLHAEEIIGQLQETISANSGTPLIFHKFEGDAVFFYAELNDDSVALQLAIIARQAERFYSVFYKKIKELIGMHHACPCDACRNIPNLRLRMYLHTGPVVFKKVNGLCELGGWTTIQIRRLLKNQIDSFDNYMAITESFLIQAENLYGRRGVWHMEKQERMPIRLKVITIPEPSAQLPPSPGGSTAQVS